MTYGGPDTARKPGREPAALVRGGPDARQYTIKDTRNGSRAAAGGRRGVLTLGSSTPLDGARLRGGGSRPFDLAAPPCIRPRLKTLGI